MIPREDDGKTGPPIEVMMNEQGRGSPEPRRLSATALRKLSASERAAIHEEQAALAEENYRHVRDLTSFEAFGEDDLHVNDSFTEEG